MKKLLIAFFMLLFIALTATSCWTSRQKPCPAYYSSTQTTQSINPELNAR